MVQEKDLNEGFIAYQNQFKEIVDQLKQNCSSDWKGFITINGPVQKRPQLLFIGIHPGPGLSHAKRKIHSV